MKRIAARFDDPHRPGRMAWAMVLLLVLLAASAVAWAWLARADLVAKKAELESLTRLQSDAAEAQAHRPAVVPPYDASARQMLKERQMPWPVALTAIENVAMVGVTATSVEFAASEGKVQLEVLFSEHAKLLEYADALNAGLEPSARGWRWAIRQTQLNANHTGERVQGVAVLEGVWR
jgi:hypothetical protein